MGNSTSGPRNVVGFADVSRVERDCIRERRRLAGIDAGSPAPPEAYRELGYDTGWQLCEGPHSGEFHAALRGEAADTRAAAVPADTQSN